MSANGVVEYDATVSIYERVFRALGEAGARYVVVGGLATVLHGYARLTADIDLVVDLEPSEARKVMAALESLGLRPRAPVTAAEFADPEKRRQWVEEKGMQVFSLWDPREPLLEVDVFVTHPIPFDELWHRSEELQLERARVRVVSIADLIALKRLAGRPQDLQDIEALEAIVEQRRETKR